MIYVVVASSYEKHYFFTDHKVKHKYIIYMYTSYLLLLLLFLFCFVKHTHVEYIITLVIY